MKILNSAFCFLFLITSVSNNLFATDYSFNNCSTSEFQQNPFIVHTAKQGESISSILKRYQLPLSDFLKSNPYVKAKWDISVGDILHIPRSAMGDATDQSIDLDIKAFLKQKDVATGGVDTQEVQEPSKLYNATKIDARNIAYDNHNVLPKETLYSISKKYNVEINDIIEANPDIMSNGLREYNVIRIPRKTFPKTSTSPVSSNVKVVNEKDVMPFEIFDNQYEKNQINISLLLPITQSKEKSEEGFVDLYRGFLLAMDSLKKEGLSTKVDMFGVGRGTDKLNEILSSQTFNTSNLIIGPVFNNQFSIVAQVASNRDIPIISPLLQVDANNPFVFEVMPSNDTYYDKAKVFLKDKNIILYTSLNDDNAFINDVERFTGGFDAKIPYNKHSKPESMIHFLSKDKPNVFIVAAKDNLNIEMLLSKLVALRATAYNYKISTFGSSNMGIIPKERRGDFFKVDLRYITSAFQDRTNEESLDFETKYINKFNYAPTPFSYRGFELGIIFVGAMFRDGYDIQRTLNDKLIKVIQAEYLFYQKDRNSKFVNQEWMFVNYTPNYNIIIE